jgi:hypothetical protein
MNMEHWRNDTDGGELKYWKRKSVVVPLFLLQIPDVLYDVKLGLTPQYGAVEYYNHPFKKGYESVSCQN